MQAYIVFGQDTTYMFEAQADAFEAAWRESYNQFGKAVDIWEGIDGNAHILASVSANRMTL